MIAGAESPVKVEVARVLPTGASDDEPQRAFLQDRMGLWAFWVFVLSFGFYLTNMATAPFVRTGAPRRHSRRGVGLWPRGRITSSAARGRVTPRR